MNPVERVEILELREEMRDGFREMREDIARGFRDQASRDADLRDRVSRVEGGVAVIRWLGPAGIAAILLGLLFQAGILR